MALRENQWVRAGLSQRCPICKSAGWCSIAKEGKSVICMRVEMGSVKQTANGGWLHILETRINITVNDVPRVRRLDLPTKVGEYQNAVHPEHLEQFAVSLGVTALSLSRLGVGWCFDGGLQARDAGDAVCGIACWCFPMFDAGGAVIGIKRRLADGQKRSIAGGLEGLFIATGIADGSMLLICEGCSDTAAMLDLGFNAVGRPSCVVGGRMIAQYVQDHRHHQVVVVGDDDDPGRRGAADLADRLCHVAETRIVLPQGAKDAREWVRAGAVMSDVMTAIEAAPIHRERFQIKTLKMHGRRKAVVA